MNGIATRRRGSRRPRCLLQLGLIAALLAPPSMAWARPGGGGSFRSHRSRSSQASGSRSSTRRSSSRSSGVRSRGVRSSPSRPRSSGRRPNSPGAASGTAGTSYREPAVSITAVRRGFAPGRVWRPGASGSVYGPAPEPEETECRYGRPVEARTSPLVVTAWIGGILVPPGILAVVLLFRRRRRRRGGAAAPPTTARLVVSKAHLLRVIGQDDPYFSVVLLEDFIYALYAEVQIARGAGRLQELAPYLEDGPLARLQELGARPVSAIVVGSLTIVEFLQLQTAYQLTVELETNYAEAWPEGERAFWAVERWQLRRSVSARSRPPDRVRVFACPNCGAPLDRLVGRACGYCSQPVGGGGFDWVVSGLELRERARRGPMLTGSTEERGTSAPTIFDHRLDEELRRLVADDPDFDQQQLLARTKLIFETLQVAWSELQWERARPYLSDALFEAQRYWINAYRAAGLRNVTLGSRLKGVELVRLLRDRWYDALTVRISVSGPDYTVREEDGAVVVGSPSSTRAYTEYWTLVRSSGRSGPTQTAACCPSCGAPLEVNMAAVCAHCEAKVNSGEFDWVLSRIEQDEVYAG